MWDDAFPSFLIGLREGLEAGLIVSILVATLVRAGNRTRLPQVWTGVLAAVAVSMSFGAVLTFTAANLPTAAQEAFGGTLSVIAVAFVTAMIFWMRRSARNLSTEIREKVTSALGMGAGVLVLTSFLAVGREGLETALFLWTTARAAGESAGPMAGAAAGLLLAAGLCWGLYRRVLRINLTRFFTATGVVLIVIASGVLGYGLRDLQEGGVLPGAGAYAFDLTGSVDAGSWYGTLLQGVFNLTPQMTWLQVAAYALYLVTVMALFIRGLRTAAPKAPREAPREEPARAPRRRPAWLVPAAVVTVPVVAAASVIALGGSAPARAQTIAVSGTDCGKGFTAPARGQQAFRMHNTGSQVSEVYLIDPVTGAVYGEIEGLAPGTTRDLVATIAGGRYAWRCVPTGGHPVTSAAVTVGGGGGATAVRPVSEADLRPALTAYRAYVDRGLTELAGQTRRLADDIRGGDLERARADWLTAHLTYSSLGAAYGTFEDFAQRIDGRADGLPRGERDPGFTGFHRVEYQLWHSDPADRIQGTADRLAADVTALQKAFPHQDFDVSDLPLRTHEILENTLQFELTGDTDEGSGTNLATARANLDGTRELLGVLRPLITQRDPGLLSRVDAGLAREQRLLDAAHSGGHWTPVQRLDAAARAELDGATGQLLEDLAPIPDLLEIRKAA